MDVEPAEPARAGLVAVESLIVDPRSNHIRVRGCWQARYRVRVIGQFVNLLSVGFHVVTDSKPPEWFDRLDSDAQAALLADPHGGLPGWLAKQIMRHVKRTYWPANDSEGSWQLWPEDARLIEAEAEARRHEAETGA